MLNKKDIISKNQNTDISKCNVSYSPYFSNIGIVTDETVSGIKSLCFHYNRSTRTVWAPFASFEGGLNKSACTPCELIFEKADKRISVSFYDTDCFVLEGKNISEIILFDEETASDGEIWCYTDESGNYCVRGYSTNGDSRDPDRYVPFLAAVKIFSGKGEWKDKRLYLASENDKVYIAVCFEILDIDEERVLRKLKSAPDEYSAAYCKSEKWAEECLNGLSWHGGAQKENDILLNAVSGMLYNFKKAPGLLSGYTAYYPNRGGYPCHFLWDTCFQNLALEIINPELAAESLLLIAKCQRNDGKYPQFMCSTWQRPLDTQPALVGWAAKRLYMQMEDKVFKKQFAETIFKSIEENNKWWLRNRMTHYGVIYCDDGLETGQDNSPRFDGRIILAVDMNSYLLNQIRAASFFADELGLRDKSLFWNEQADKLSENMIKHLYCEEENLFYDALVSNGEKVKIQTSSCFIPLWANVEIDRDRAINMIEKYLLDENRFFSKVPFPSVAYNESVYEADGWWRGPTWPPIAWLMLEILRNYGLDDAYTRAFDKIYNLLLEDGKLHELFNSQTGEGLGNADQGWTQAIFIRMFYDKYNK